MGMPELDHMWLITVGHVLDFILRAFGNHVLSKRETKSRGTLVSVSQTSVFLTVKWLH